MGESEEVGEVEGAEDWAGKEEMEEDGREEMEVGKV